MNIKFSLEISDYLAEFIGGSVCCCHGAVTSSLGSLGDGVRVPLQVSCATLKTKKS